MAERLSLGNVEDKKLKTKMMEDSPIMKGLEAENLTLSLTTKMEEGLESENPTLSLTLATGAMVDESHSKSSKDREGSGSNTLQNHLEDPCFPCGFCNRRFSSSQALGGHQNAHRSERSPLNKRKKTNEAEDMEEADLFANRGLGSFLSSNYSSYSTTVPSLRFQGLSPHPYHHAGSTMMRSHMTSHVPSLPSCRPGSIGSRGFSGYGPSYGTQPFPKASSLLSPQQRFGMNSSWREERTGILERLNHNRHVGLLNELSRIPSLAETATHFARRLGHDDDHQDGSPSVSPNDPTSQELDLTLGL